MRTCLIYGHDGFDVDVLLNLRAFYKSLGFRVAHARSLIPADLLVVQRIPDMPLPVAGYTDVHLFDYVGTPYPRLLRSLAGTGPNVAVFCSSAERRAAIQAIEPALRDRVFVQLPPVKVELWATPRLDHPCYRAVHIGHYKPYYRDMNDPHSTAFIRALETFRDIRVWGNGWEAADTGANVGPRIVLGRVSRTYARSTSALGMMYPHQRGISLSGRFWHAPLNGCRLVSEPSVYAGVLPGVAATDYSLEDVARLLEETVDRRAVQEAAMSYWSTAYVAARDIVAPMIRSAPRTHLNRHMVRSLAGHVRRATAQRVY